MEDINNEFNNKLVAQGQRSVDCYALHKVARSQTTSSSSMISEDFDHGSEDDYRQSNTIDSGQALSSGLSASERHSCLLRDTDGSKSGKMHSCLHLSIGSRVMLIQNVDTKLGLVNGTTGTVVGFVFNSAEGANKIVEKLDMTSAASIEPQIPVVFVRVDEEFWRAPDHNFIIPPPINKPGNWDRVIAIPPVESNCSFRMKFTGGTKTVTRIQLPLIPAFALTIHKSQGLNKAHVLYVASSKLFARALAYVALSRCTTLEGLYIVGKKMNSQHFKQTFGREDGIIKAETTRLRKFQGNTLRKGHKATCTYLALGYDCNAPIEFNEDEPEFDQS